MSTVHLGVRIRVRPDQIRLLRAEKNYTCIYFFEKKEKIVATTLKELIKRLPEDMFIRVNRKEFVNRSFIKNYRIARKNDYVELLDGGVLTPSRRGRRPLRSIFILKEPDLVIYPPKKSPEGEEI